MRRARWAPMAGLALGLLLAAAPAAARSPIYRYVDDHGVAHFSNAPADSRYRPVSLRPRGLEVRGPSGPGTPVHHGYDLLIVRAARRYRLEPALVKAVIAAESNFDSDAVSRAGALGLMQLMPTTAQHLGVADAFHPSQNIDGGVRYLRKMLDRYGDLSRALAAYNAGPEAVDRHRGIPPYRETRAYVSRVLNYYRDYHEEFLGRSSR